MKCLLSFKDAQVSTILNQTNPWPSLDPCCSHCFMQNFLKEFFPPVVSTHFHFKLLQSGFGTQHCIETALSKVTRGCFVTKFNGHFSFLSLFDFSVVFNSEFFSTFTERREVLGLMKALLLIVLMHLWLLLHFLNGLLSFCSFLNFAIL